MIKNFKNKNGFTLVEIMVATSIFMIIMLVALGALISSSDTAKKSQALRTAMDNVNFAMESMTRSLRMGTDYYCVLSGSSVSLPVSIGTYADCPLSGAGGGAVVFTGANETTPRNSAFTVVPRNDPNGTYVLQKCSPDCVDLVSQDVNVEKLTFYVDGSDPSDKLQPSVYILVNGVVTIKGEKNPFSIQTMASQRSSE